MKFVLLWKKFLINTFPTRKTSTIILGVFNKFTWEEEYNHSNNWRVFLDKRFAHDIKKNSH